LTIFTFLNKTTGFGNALNMLTMCHSQPIYVYSTTIQSQVKDGLKTVWAVWKKKKQFSSTSVATSVKNTPVIVERLEAERCTLK